MYDYDDNSAAKNRQSFYSSSAFGSNTSDSSSDTVVYDRPRSITVIAWLSVLSLGYSLIQFFGLLKDASYLPGWIWPFLLINYALTIVSIVGLFGMRKYGAWAFVLQTVIGTIFSLAVGAGAAVLLGMVLSVVFLYFIFSNYSMME